MSYVVFENDGVIDARSIRTFGISVKETSNPIGFFGTGLKYAIAVLMRTNHKVTLFAGLQKYVFEKKQINVRGKDFEAINMNGEEMAFTTHLGSKWEIWQAFRELYCNVIDENGDVSLCIDMPNPEENKTYFIVEGEEFEHAFSHRGEIVFQPKADSLCDGSMEIYVGGSKNLYYRGIRVFDFERPAMFTYNLISQADLTEDRTLKYTGSVGKDIALGISRLTDKSIIRQILTAEDFYYEHTLPFEHLRYYSSNITPEFKEILEELFKRNTDKLNRSAREYHQHCESERTSKHYEPYDLSIVEQKQLDRARKICMRLFDDFDQYKILCVKNLGESTMALADEDAGTMVISKRTFAHGTKYLMSTLIEEFIHLKTGHGDLTRGMQTYLFDLICTLIEDHVLQEPI